MNASNTASTSSNGPTAPTVTTQLSDSSDRNNNANDNVNRRPSVPPRSPPVGARPLAAKDLPPGAAPLGSIPRPNVPHSVPPSPSSSISAVSSSSVPLLASQLGRPVNLGNHHHPHHLPVTASAAAAAAAAALASGMPPLSPHHLNLLSHTLSPFAAIPTGNGKIMARNINGTCEYFSSWTTV